MYWSFPKQHKDRRGHDSVFPSQFTSGLLTQLSGGSLPRGSQVSLLMTFIQQHLGLCSIVTQHLLKIYGVIILGFNSRACQSFCYVMPMYKIFVSQQCKKHLTSINLIIHLNRVRNKHKSELQWKQQKAVPSDSEVQFMWAAVSIAFLVFLVRYYFWSASCFGVFQVFFSFFMISFATFRKRVNVLKIKKTEKKKKKKHCEGQFRAKKVSCRKFSYATTPQIWHKNPN